MWLFRAFEIINLNTLNIENKYSHIVPMRSACIIQTRSYLSIYSSDRLRNHHTFPIFIPSDESSHPFLLLLPQPGLLLRQ